MDRGAWRAVVHGVTELDRTEQLSTAQHLNARESGPSSRFGLSCERPDCKDMWFHKSQQLELRMKCPILHSLALGSD